MSRRNEKLPELLMHLAAEWIELESNRTSLITVTNARMSENGRRIVIYYTVLPDDKEGVVSEFLNRRKRDFFAYVDKKAKIGRMPEIQFAFDVGEKNRQRIDFLLENE
jgi:ribosome-binding factor A